MGRWRAVAAVGAIFALGGCGETVEDVARNADFKAACEGVGGRVYGDGWGGYRCDLTTEED